MKYKGRCHCGNIEFEVDFEPLFTQLCHCHKCRRFAAMSHCEKDKVGYSRTAAFPYNHFHILKGDKKLEKHEGQASYLYLCSNCKMLIYGLSKDPNLQQGIGVNGNTFDFPKHKIPESFIPIRHVYYADRTVNIKDSLPKFADFPIELGGSGKILQV